MVTGKLQISSITEVMLSSIGSLVGSIAAAGCARIPVALNASKLSKTRSRNLRIILLLPSPAPSPATELHQAPGHQGSRVSRAAPWRAALRRYGVGGALGRTAPSPGCPSMRRGSLIACPPAGPFAARQDIPAADDCHESTGSREDPIIVVMPTRKVLVEAS